jgi:sigma54-dependent transcription regulator
VAFTSHKRDNECSWKSYESSALAGSVHVYRPSRSVWNSAIAGSQEDGPILTLLRYRPFEKVVLLSTPRTVDRTLETEKEIGHRFPSTEVSVHHLELANPTEYRPILEGLRHVFQIVADSPDKCRYFVATASGTPQMHASLLLLIASGEVPATCLYVRQPQFVQEASDPIVEIDPSQAHFPAVRFRPPAAEIDEENVPDATGVAERLGIVGKHPAFLKTIDTAAVLAESSLR